MATAAPAPGAAPPAAAAAPADPKLVKLRELMAASGIDAFVIPSEDPHMVSATHPQQRALAPTIAVPWPHTSIFAAHTSSFGPFFPWE